MTDYSQVQFGEHLTRSQERKRAAWACGPAVLWVSLFLLLPLIGVLVLGFTTRGAYGQVQWSFTLDNFARFLGFGRFGFDAIYLRILLRSLIMAGVTAGLCVLGAFPLAFATAALPPRAKQIALVLIVIPFWTNLLIRTYAWQIVLSGSGWLAQGAAVLGWIGPGQGLYPSAWAVYLGLACDYLPFLVLPLYASVEKLDWSIAEAASDLGANRRQVFWHALLPQLRPGLVAGIVLVFVPATGQFIIPDLLGGAKTVLLGNAIQQQFGASRDWPFGSAMACLAMGVVMLGLWFYSQSAGAEASEGLS
jgi:spermidine/putrescine transport system permease protein